MGKPGKGMHVRLPTELAAKFEALCDAMPSMARSHVLRLLLEHSLDGTLDTQLQIITQQLIRRKPTSHTHNRLNTSRREG